MSPSNTATKLKPLFAQLRKRGVRYWVTVAVLLIIGTLAGEWLSDKYVWIRLRYWIYGNFQNATRVDNLVKHTVVVLIDDDEYWKGKLDRRVPLKRDYLAGLVEALAKNEPLAIALDVDLRSPVPERGAEELEAYRGETQVLLDTIKNVSQTHRIVLATTVVGDDTGYSISPNVFDNYPFDPERVTHGYVTLPRDLRQVPLSVSLKNRAEKEESFAEAIARIKGESLVATAEKFEHRGFPYGSFYYPSDFPRISAGAVLQGTDTKLRDKIQGQIVIVGGAWHTGSYKGSSASGYDDAIDLHFTPAGDIPGAFVHANYVEAFLSGVHRQVPETVAVALEILCSLMVAVAFALEGSLRRKLAQVLAISVVLVIVSYFSWQNLGLFFDFFIPILLLSIHAPIEQLRETRAEMRHLRAKVKVLESKNAQPVQPIIEETTGSTA